MVDRRDFLKGAIAMSAVLAAPQIISAAPGKGYPLGIAPLSLIELTPPNRVACAAEAGYSSIGMRLVPATPTEAKYDLVSTDSAVRKATFDMLKKTGLTVEDIEIISLKPDFKAKDYESVFVSAKEFGAKRALLAGYDKDMNRLIDNFAAMCDLAATYNITCIIEFMPFTDVKDLKMGAEVVKKANKPNAGIAFDLMHFHYSGSTIEDIKNTPPAYFSIVHMCDGALNPPTDIPEIIHHVRGKRENPGKGGIDIVSVLKALPRNLPICVECINERDAYNMSPLERIKGYFADSQKIIAEANYS